MLVFFFLFLSNFFVKEFGRGFFFDIVLMVRKMGRRVVFFVRNDKGKGKRIK